MLRTIWLSALLALGLFFAGGAHATAYTSTGNCNWNTGACWTGGTGSDWPSTAADTATISASNDVTIPAGVTIDVGAITYTAGTSGNYTKIIVNGRLNLNGTAALADSSGLDLGGSGVLDLKGNAVTTGGATEYTWGSATPTATCGPTDRSTCAKVISTGARGSFASGAWVIQATVNYTDISGLADSVFARGHASGVLQTFRHSTFTDMENWSIDETATNVNVGMVFDYNDIRSPHTPTGTDYQPRMDYGGAASGGIGTNPREFIGNTWDGDTLLGLLWCKNCGGTVTFNNNIIKNFQITAGQAYTAVSYNFLYNNLGSDQAYFLTGGFPTVPVSYNYAYYDGGAHAWGYINGDINATYNVLEATGEGGDWFLHSADNYTNVIQYNLWIGKGTVLTDTNPSVTSMDIAFNTVAVANEDPQQFPNGIIGEGTAVFSPGSNVRYYNNILFSTTTSTKAPAGMYLLDTTPGQVAMADYNVGWWPGKSPSAPPILYLQGIVGLQTIIPGLGAHDLAVNPGFLDPTRNLGAWDASLGGPGTPAHAIAELLKVNGAGGTWNQNYSLNGAWGWVRYGFTPTNPALRARGYGGADIGAIPVQPRNSIIPLLVH